MTSEERRNGEVKMHLNIELIESTKRLVRSGYSYRKVYRCECGVVGSRSKILHHLSKDHGIPYSDAGKLLRGHQGTRQTC